MNQRAQQPSSVRIVVSIVVVVEKNHQ